MNRRDFLSNAIGATAIAAAQSRAAPVATRSLRILILGGTEFLGVHMTNAALARGHTVTLFNRGRTNPGLFPKVEHLHGDRDGKLDALRGRRWDAVIDDSGYVPRHVRLSAELLAPNVRQYVFISSIAVYRSFRAPNSEDSALASLVDERNERVDDATYGPFKVASERALESIMPGRVTVVRPGFIVGPLDGSGRFTYWPARAARGGELLAPDRPGDGIQFIDARDLAAFALGAIERRTTGVFNTLSPPGHFTIGQLVHSSVVAAEALAHPKPPSRATWVSVKFLRAQGIVDQPHVPVWGNPIPIWLPPEGATAGFAETNVRRALAAGLRCRRIEVTVADTLKWYLSLPAGEREKLGSSLAPERERELLKAWHSMRT